MPAKGVVNRQRVGEALITTARTHAHPVGERLQTHLAAVLDVGETLPDFILLQELLARYLETRLDALVASDALAHAGRQTASEARERRDRELGELYETIRALRAGFAGILGHAAAARLLGVRGVTARHALGLLCQARRVLQRLREPLPELTEGLPRVELHAAETADLIQPGVERLNAAAARAHYLRPGASTGYGPSSKVCEWYPLLPTSRARGLKIARPLCSRSRTCRKSNRGRQPNSSRARRLT